MNFKQLQKLYQTYAFLETDGTAEAKPVAGEAEDEAISIWNHHMVHMRALINRTYESPFKWYYVVFKPYNKTYNKDTNWYQYKAMDYCRKYFKLPKVLIQVREIEATKTHVHAIVCTSQALVDGCSTPKYKLSAVELADIGDRRRILNYLIKESKNRSFKLYLDYIFTPKNL